MCNQAAPSLGGPTWGNQASVNFIGGGTANKMYACLISGTYCLDFSTTTSFCLNTILGGNNNVIIGRYGINCAQDPPTISKSFITNNFIGGGLQNHICVIDTLTFQDCPKFGLSANTILGGFQNRICGGYYGYRVEGSVIAGMRDNLICTYGKSGGNVGTVFIGDHCRVIDDISCNSTSFFNTISKSTSTFSIKHPDPAKHNTHRLYHTTVESPTAGDNLYRYTVLTKNGCGVYELPSYYKFLNCNDQVWLTPKDHFGNAWGCVNESQTQIEIKSDQDGEYYVMLLGTRKDQLAKRAWTGVERFSEPTNINEPENGRGLEFK